MSVAFLFPGQGTQQPGMLGWIDSRPECAALRAALAVRLGADWRERLAKPDWATTNAVAQPLLTGLTLAAWQCVAPRLPRPVAIAGYSVGELAAFAAAGVLDTDTALDLAEARAAAMDRAAAGTPAGLLAVHALPAAAQQDWAQRHGLALAIRLGPDKGIYGGAAAALDAAEQELAAAGQRVTRLAVRVASHTPLMAAAVDDFAARLAGLAWRVPITTLVCNASAAPCRAPDDLPRQLAGQIARPVLWDRCMEAVAERAPRCVLELGPGSTLAKLWRERYPEIPSRSADEFRSPEAIVDWVRRA